MKEKNLDYFMNLQYGAVIKKVEDTYYVFIPELSLFAEGNSPSEAYERLESEKEAHFKRILAIGAGDTVKEPLAVRVRRRIGTELLYFAGKAIVAGIVLVLVICIVLPVFDVFVTARMNPMRVLNTMIVKFDQGLSNISEKDQEERKKTIRRIAWKIKPYTDELKILFSDDEKMTKQLREEKTAGAAGHR